MLNKLEHMLVNNKLSDESDTGYVLEVDLEYSKSLHYSFGCKLAKL
jgi:hypothetical protein